MKKLTVPKAALPVARYIRKMVKRPSRSALPVLVAGNSPSVLRWLIGGFWTCPMGLLREAMNPTGTYHSAADRVPFDHLAIIAFENWWDSLDDAKAAVDAVWGKRK